MENVNGVKRFKSEKERRAYLKSKKNAEEIKLTKVNETPKKGDNKKNGK